jgi:hypothetical protein
MTSPHSPLPPGSELPVLEELETLLEQVTDILGRRYPGVGAPDWWIKDSYPPSAHIGHALFTLVDLLGLIFYAYRDAVHDELTCQPLHSDLDNDIPDGFPF